MRERTNKYLDPLYPTTHYTLATELFDRRGLPLHDMLALIHMLRDKMNPQSAQDEALSRSPPAVNDRHGEECFL